MTIQDAAASLHQRLAQVSDTPAMDAQVLMAHLLGKPRAWVMAHPDANLEATQQQALADAVARLEAGEPLPYMLGHWEFYGLDFTVTPDTLIPRPETELLVETALHWLRAHPDRRLAADIGAGTGCIAVTLAYHIHDLQVLAVDISERALQVAHANAARHGVASRVVLQHSDLLSNTAGQFDLLCANLPYIPSEMLPSLDVSRREPLLALDGGAGGLKAIQRLLDQAPANMNPGGLVLLEIEASQGKSVQRLAQNAFPGAAVQVLPDLAGKDRLIQIELS